MDGMGLKAVPPGLKSNSFCGFYGTSKLVP
jgi:hypothetical protein